DTWVPAKLSNGKKIYDVKTLFSVVVLLRFKLLALGFNNKLPPPANDNSLAENQEYSAGRTSLAIKDEEKDTRKIKTFIPSKLGLY
mgnify:CR=1